MKNLKKVIVLALLAVFTSCATSSDVVSDGLFQKRKYRKGVYIEKSGANGFDKKEVIEDEVVEVIDDENNTATNKTYSSNENVDLTNLPDEISSVDAANDDVIDVENEEVVNTFSNKSAAIALMKDYRDVRRTIDNQPLSVRTSPEASAAAESGAMLVLLIILCLILPPVAIAIYSGITTWFWIDLLLVLLAIGGWWFIGGLSSLAGLAAVIIAFLVIFDVI